MTREAALAVMIAVAVAVLGLLVFAWWRRTRRDAGLAAPVGEAPSDAATVAVHDALYVATTRHGDPLERLAIRGLGFRSRADVTVTSAGVAIDLTGQPRLFLPTDRIVGVAQATVAIDRVVERDGLVRISWRVDADTVVDSYLRPQDASARTVADEIGSLLTLTGTDE
ncbi:MAG: PH-like domain-containing protein [Microbacterium sp.]